jgi:adenylosuccinate synthase
MTGLALTKLDVLDGLDQLQLCTAYRLGGQTLDAPPARSDEMAAIEPVYEAIAGWGDATVRGHQSLADLPDEATAYVRRIEDFVGVPVCLLSVGPDREETMEVRDPFASQGS